MNASIDQPALDRPVLDLSVVIPVYNEEESLPKLVEELHAALDPTGMTYELILVDDGSRDGSYRWLKKAAAKDEALTVIRFRRNFGQTAALQAGLDAARGELIATMDADLQNDPHDIPMMIKVLHEGLEGSPEGADPEFEGYDMVAGWRADRQDAFINRRLPSIIANRIISKTTKVRLHDYGCTLKVMRRALAKEIRLYGEMHRFIPAVASWIGATVAEVKVNHRARQFGTSKYGIGRTTRVILDLITVRYIQSYLVKPMQVFGKWGFLSGFVGFIICAWLALQKIIYGSAIADRPMLLLGILLIVVGVQLISLGLVADILQRTYHEAQDKPTYHVRTRIVGEGHVAGHQAAQAEG
ncbi:MAG: glycosyltransferase family 2 protein [Bradymonadia bacterium]